MACGIDYSACMIRAYLSILRAYPAVIAFGFLATFFSNVGQTYFIGLYSEFFQQSFGLSNTGFGSIYSAVTLASAGALLLLGHVIDKVRLRVYVAYACLALALGCMLMAHAAGLGLFVLGLWLVRFHGQGVMIHMSSTVTAREIDIGRGRGLSLTVLGQPLGEVVLPVLFASVMVMMDWRTAWQIYGWVYVLAALPLMVWLAPVASIELHDELHASPKEQMKLRHVLRDSSLWLLMLANMLMPFLITGIMFHQKWLMENLGFSAELYAYSLTAFGVGHAVAGLLAGGVVDRIGAVQVLRWFLVPFIGASLLLVTITEPYILPVFMLATALTAGCTHSARGSYLAERYGTGQLGAIKSFFASSMVFSTALSPALFGVIMDYTNNAKVIFHICWICALLTLLLLRFLQSGKAMR
jgi:MFS family permease